MVGSTVLITGATDGLGHALALSLAKRGAKLAVHGRCDRKLEKLISRLRTAGAVDITAFRADLADLTQVRAFSAQVLERLPRLDVLVNNAGVGFAAPEGEHRIETTDGLELRLAVNYVAGVELSLGVLPLLRQTGGARIVNVASKGQHPLEFEDLQFRRGYNSLTAYRRSKLAQIMGGFALASRVAPDQVTVNSLHPATYMPTKMVLQGRGEAVDKIETGVRAVEHLVLDPALAHQTGTYFDGLSPALAHPQAYEHQAQQRLWEWTCGLLGRSTDL